MTLTIEILAQQLSAEIRGDGSLILTGAHALEKAGPTELTFASDEYNLRNLKSSRACAALIGRKLADSPHLADVKQTLLIVPDAKWAFLIVLERFYPPRPRARMGISAQAIVHPTAIIGKNTNVHAGAYVSEDVIIGEECEISPGVYVGPGCRLGDQTVLYPHVVLYPNVVLGNRVVIHAGTIIGIDGFGYQLMEGVHQKVPHFGSVIVEDDVEIGANTTIDRSLVGATRIGRGTKIDNLVIVAHNCELGQHNLLASQVGIAGSVTTGDYVTCAGQVGVADHVHLGAGVTLAAQTGVPKSLPPGGTYFGTPAQPIEEMRKSIMAARKLPQLREAIRDLKIQMTAMQKQLDALTAARSAEGPTDIASAA